MSSRRPRKLCDPGHCMRFDHEAEIKRLRAYIQGLDGKHIGMRTGDTFIDDGVIVAADILGGDDDEIGAGLLPAPSRGG